MAGPAGVSVTTGDLDLKLDIGSKMGDTSSGASASTDFTGSGGITNNAPATAALSMLPPGLAILAMGFIIYLLLKKGV